jgi:hypothetical protein
VSPKKQQRNNLITRRLVWQARQAGGAARETVRNLKFYPKLANFTTEVGEADNMFANLLFASY